MRTTTEDAREAKPWVVGLARLGYFAKGIVYIVIGILAIQGTPGGAGREASGQGALRAILSQPFGQVLLGAVAIGLFAYALWRIVQAWLDPDREGSDASGLVKRAGYAVSGIVYGLLGVAAVRLILGSRGSGGGSGSAQDWTARLMSQPFGQWLVGIVGVIVIGVGLYQFYRAYSAKFREKLLLSEMSSREDTWATRAGRIGFTARGVVYAMIGYFLIDAAVQAQPGEAGGLGQAFRELSSQPYGPWLLGAVALGFVAYGIFAFVLARYRRIYL